MSNLEIEEYNKLSTTQKEELQSWIKGRFTHRKTINNHTSYGYKHVFENDRHGFYISNEQFKGAMKKQVIIQEISHLKIGVFMLSFLL